MGRDESQRKGVTMDIYCDQQWHPTPDEKVRLSAEMKKGWDLYRATKS